MCFAPQRRALFRHFFDIWTSKSGPSMVCFVHFDLEMGFAPQRRALFRHRNFQKWSDHGVFCTFWLQNVLRATTACTFSTSQLPKVVRSSSVLSILTWKCASRHNGVHFFMSHLASWLRTRRFSEPTFRPSGATNHWKNTVNRDFPIFSLIYLFFLLIFSLLTLFTSAFQLSILSEVSLLNFLRLWYLKINLIWETWKSCMKWYQVKVKFQQRSKLPQMQHHLDHLVPRAASREISQDSCFSNILKLLWWTTQRSLDVGRWEHSRDTKHKNADVANTDISIYVIYTTITI